MNFSSSECCLRDPLFQRRTPPKYIHINNRSDEFEKSYWRQRTFRCNSFSEWNCCQNRATITCGCCQRFVSFMDYHWHRFWAEKAHSFRWWDSTRCCDRTQQSTFRESIFPLSSQLRWQKATPSRALQRIDDTISISFSAREVFHPSPSSRQTLHPPIAVAVPGSVLECSGECPWCVHRVAVGVLWRSVEHSISNGWNTVWNCSCENKVQSKERYLFRLCDSALKESNKHQRRGFSEYPFFSLCDTVTDIDWFQGKREENYFFMFVSSFHLVRCSQFVIILSIEEQGVAGFFFESSYSQSFIFSLPLANSVFIFSSKIYLQLSPRESSVLSLHFLSFPSVHVILLN